MTDEGQNTLEEFGYRQELRRALTFKDLLIYGLVFMAPIAPMTIYGIVAEAGSGMVPLVYLIGLIAITFTALSYRQMSRRYPIAGSVYSYVRRGLRNEHIGFLAGWLILLDYLLVPALLYKFVGTFTAALIPSVPLWAFTIFFVVAITVINILGITLASRVNIVVLGVQIALVLLFVGLAVKYVFVDGLGAGGFSLEPLYQAGNVDWGFIATATSIAALSFLGFDAISTLAEESKEPTRTVGNAIVASLLVVGSIFMLVTYLAALVQPDYAKLTTDIAFFEISELVGGRALYTLILLVQIVTIVATGVVAQIAISRVLYAMSRDRLLPFSGTIGKIHPRLNTPVAAILLVAASSIVISVLVDIDMIAQLVTFGALSAFLALHVSVLWTFVIRERRRTLRDILNFAFLPAIGFAILAYIWSGFGSLTLIVGISWLFVGILLLAVRTRGFSATPDVTLLEEHVSEVD